MSTTTSTAPAEQPGSSRGGVVLGAILLAFGILLTLVGSAVLTAGILAAGVNQLRDDDGYFTSPAETFATDSYALTTPTVGRLTLERGVGSLPFDLATIRLQAVSADDDVFVGIASHSDIQRYLGDVARTEIRDVRYFPFEVEYRDLGGAQPPTPPGEQDFWVASASGAGVQTLEWSLTPGSWGLVVMNADGGDGVTVDLQAGVRSDLFAPAATTLLVVGGVLLLIGIPLLIIGAVTLGRGVARRGGPRGGAAVAAPAAATQAAAGSHGAVPPAAVPPAAAPGRPTRYPAQVVGVRDAELSRWLPLVKWLLVIPHYLILIFLWFAMAVTTVFAGFAILFTARYPHSLFTFNVGVLRWSWRVGFYAYSALGTDRYPPFTLARTDYPADFDIPYPERLSRGLVLVKWWLLAIPHYLILAAISGDTIVRWTDDDDDRFRTTGLSLIGVLVLIAAVALIFAARYPAGMFDLLVGINRWVLRVVTYAALFRDEYPPFRLDQGPLEPTASVDPNDLSARGTGRADPL